MTKEQVKQAVISILVSVVAFIITSLSDVLVDFLRSNAEQVVSSVAGTAVYLAKAYKG